MQVPIHERNPPWTPPLYDINVLDHQNMIETFAKWIKPDIYVEYGIDQGHVVNKIAQYARKVYAVDTNDYTPPFDNVQKMKCMTRDFKKYLMTYKLKIDMVFIDADHHHKESFQDFVDIFPHVNDNGFIFLRNTYPTVLELTQDHFCSDSWKTPMLIRQHYGNAVDILTIPVCPGLTIVRKRLNLEWMNGFN